MTLVFLLFFFKKKNHPTMLSVQFCDAQLRDILLPQSYTLIVDNQQGLQTPSPKLVDKLQNEVSSLELLVNFGRANP